MNDGFTLAELSIASAVVVVLFGFVMTISSFVGRQLDRRSSRAIISAQAALLSSQLARDFRQARSIDTSENMTIVFGQNNARIEYVFGDGRVIRNNKNAVAGAQVDSLLVTVDTLGRNDIATYYFRLISDLGSDTFSTSSSVILRGAPVWALEHEDL